MLAIWKAIASRLLIGAAMATFAAPFAFAIEESPQTTTTASIADQLFKDASARAAALAATAYQTPRTDLPKPFENLDYDGYRKLRPRPETTVWGENGNAFGVLPLPRGFYYREEINVHFVSRTGETTPHMSSNFIDFVDYPGATDDERVALGVSGWRAISKPGQAGVGYEFAVFQGATYFRAVSEGQVYGVSARALAIGTGSSAGEEFPRFTDFWIVEPEGADDTLTFVALADSRSVAAAYLFVLRPGKDAVIDVVGEIHPRTDIVEAGIAPLSSMYLHGSSDVHAKIDDRPEVHDSDGLSILSVTGEHIWRPLANPSSVQLSAFSGTLAGFGLEQRRRDPAAYADAEAKYERRPNVWIEPQGDWGKGEVRLLEFPTATEYADNVAAFWHPAEVWGAGSVQRLAYRLHWSDKPRAAPVARAVSTHVAPAPEGAHVQRFTIEFQGAPDFAAKDLHADVWATSGALSNIRLVPGADARMTLFFDLDTGASPVIELHAALADSNSQQTETWLFRWTPE